MNSIVNNAIRRSLVATCLAVFVLMSSSTLAQEVDFGRDIQPILSDHCFKCHGPDEKQRKSNLRLDTKKGAFADLGGYKALVAGDTNASVLLERIKSDDPEHKMPPVDSGRTLSKAQIATFEKWIQQGAKWNEHWSFQRVTRPALPTLAGAQHPIDRFVAREHQRRKLKAAKSADRSTLIRRVTLDLTGLPPTPREVADFLNDESELAYERLVDRLIASHRFGEHMAVPWLDSARYADTSGYQNDGPRYMWRWRDWVIDAFNANKPFDVFTVEQIAGDLLLNSTLQQRIASGFNRNHRGNAEGGIIPEEYAVEYVVDRVETTAAVWLGLTIGCARCHDHKFDPISQREFYQLYSLFNNVPEYGRAIKEGNSPPYIKAPTYLQQFELKQIEERLSQAKTDAEDLSEAVGRAMEVWEATAEAPAQDWTIRRGQVLRLPLDTQLAVDGAEAKVELEGEENANAPRHGQGLTLNGSQHVTVDKGADFGYFDKFSIAAWAKPAKSTGTLVSKMELDAQGTGYGVHLQDGKIQVNLVKRWLDDSIRVETRNSIQLSKWQHIVVTYDGSRIAKGIRVYVDNVEQEMVVHLDGINQTFNAAQPLRIGAGNHPFTGSIADVRVFDRVLNADEIKIIGTPQTVGEILAVSKSKRTAKAKLKLKRYFLAEAAPPAIKEAHDELADAQETYRAFKETIPTVMVMEDFPVPRETFVLKRGQYDQPGERVFPALPSSLGGASVAVPTRLQFARWLVSRDNPLTARVRVNRLWQRFFGGGLVRTSEDFGLQGSRPTHPQLLDWLAAEFMESGWDQKQLIRLIVTSDAYRRASQVSASYFEKDPGNLWLTYGPRVRLSAEMIRDQALAAADLLTQAIGGPSVRPYQPAGLWKEIATVTDYDQSTGGDLYRRSMYTFWKRTVAPPSMMAFDATAREVCTVARSRTNTPLQALTLLNEIAFVEAARAIADRSLQRDLTNQERIEWIFLLATARKPNEQEMRVLQAAHADHLAFYRKNADAAKRLVSQGDSKPVATVDVPALAAMTAIANTILNLDETIHKP